MIAKLLPCVLLLAACNEALLNDSGGPCEGVECGRSCATDIDCDSRTYCGSENTCTRDCTPGGNECGAGKVCGFRGRCVPEPPKDDGICPNIKVEVKPIIPLVVLLIDQSGSMTAPFGTINGVSMNRWQAVRYALTDATAGAVTALQGRVRFGATLYHSRGGNRGGTCPILTKSMGQPAGLPQLNNRNAIDELLANNSPVQDTPTAESVEAVVKDITEYARLIDPQAPRVLILATDGDPDNCMNPDAHDATSRAMSERAVQAAYNAGIRTYVLSVGNEVTRSHLERLANAGVGKPLSPPSERFYQGNNPAELVEAFGTIIRGVRSCSFTLNGDVTADGAERATVLLNGQPLRFRTDWNLMDKRTLVLQGAACEQFKNTDQSTLTAEFPCGTVLF
ncbi:MAG: VWA domain-containing protein [Myxococcales bacterium]|nr:VWA domain-containing protein [Myxococcota bacterium]MDW8282030.1 VWA domain-containing protein [Myxococcales bacterium]